MEGNAAAGLIEVQLENLIDVCCKGILLIPGLEKNAQKLIQSLVPIKMLLKKAETSTREGEDVKHWLKYLENVVYAGDYILDELIYHHLSNQIQTSRRSMKAKVLTCLSCLNHYPRKWNMAIRIEMFNMALRFIIEIGCQLLSSSELVNVPTPPPSSPETDSFADDPIFVGREDEVVKLVGMLTNITQEEERVLSILAIVGMGGMGKTALTRKVFNHERMETHFGQSRIWVHVSQNFDPDTTFRTFLYKLTRSVVEVETRQVILEELHEALRDKTYLLVLDDVWNEDPNTWEDFMNSLLGVTSTKGNCIVVTTRSEKVASIVNPLHIHPLKGLSKEECWSIIKAKAFNKGDDPSEFETMGGNIVRKCCDLLLATSTTEERVFSILAIVGMGGIGKTTLAREIFKDERMETHFGQSRIWVHVSQNFEPDTIFKSFLEMMTYSVVGVESMRVIQEELREALKDKTYLLVLDDVWDEDPNTWENLMSILSGVTSTKGNCIVVTTRSQKVASIVNPLHIYALKGLSEEEWLPIIKAKYVREGDDPSESETMEGTIGRKCCGLPLAATLVAEVLCKTFTEKLNLIENSWLTKDEVQSMSKILRLSFDNLLSPSLKKCFAYCSIFPKGHRILKQTIIDLWMAEGFLQPYQSNDMESVGEKFFNVLQHNSLLLVAERDDHGNIESCVMHDLIHDLASSILAGINQVRYLVRGDADSSDLMLEVTAIYLRTLIFQGEIIDHTMFSSFKCLHVLTLDCDRATELPSSISKLIHLRNLNISATRIEYLPDWIGEFHYLQTLNAFTESLRELPSTMKYLISLRHLYIPSHVKLPPEIGTFTNLRALKFSVGEEKGYKIEELGSLKNLRELHIPNVEKVHVKEEAEKAKLFEKQNLMALQLEWGEYGEGEAKNHESVLEGFQPHPNLEKLKIKGYKGKKFPSWIPIMTVQDERAGGSLVQLNNLMNITLSCCYGCEEIPMLGHLPNLKSLHLWSLCNVKLINSSFYGIDSSNNGVHFPALESMLLSHMSELREWAQGEFRNATRVKIFPRLQSLKMYHCTKLVYLPAWLFSKAHNLSELDIRHCSKLRELPDGLRALNYLESMTIKGCQNLKSIAYPSGQGKPRGSLTSLRSLEIRDCQELKVMVGSGPAPLLKKVFMVELKRLENLPSFLDFLAESPFLQELTIVGIPKFMPTSSVEIWPFRKLQKLEIDVSREWSSETCVAIEKTVCGILVGCRFSLGELILRGLESWKCLPSPIQDLTALYSLELENFGVEELPKWFGNLSSLTRLCLSNCTKLTRLPSMQHLTKLHELRICDCPKLRIEFEIPHVCIIYVNGHSI